MKKSKQTTTQNSTANTVTTPTNPQFVTDAIKAQQGRIENLASMDPRTMIPGASSLQKAAFRMAGGLIPGGGEQRGAAQPSAAPAGNLMTMGGPDDASSVPAGSSSGPLPTGPLSGGVPQAGQDDRARFEAERAAMQGGASAPPSAGDWRSGLNEAAGIARNVLATPMNVSQAGPATQVTAQQAGPSERVTAAQARAPNAVDTAHAGSYAADAAPTVKGGSLLDVNLDGYMNPFLDKVVNSSLANFDEQAGMKGAQLAAQQAAGQKFSGSGSAIERAMFARGNIQDRTGVESGLRSQGFDKATNLATLDLDRQTQAALAEAQRADTMSRSNADRYTQNNQFNAGETNTNSRFNVDQSGLTDRSNVSEANRVGLDNAGRADETSRLNTTEGNRVALDNAGRTDETSRFNTGESNTMTRAQGDLGIRGAGLLGDLSTAGAEQTRGDIGLLSNLGNDERAIDKEVAQAPLTAAQWIADLNAKQPYDLTKGVSQDTTSSGTSKTKGSEFGLSGEDAGKLAMAAVMASDRRLKTGVKKIAKDEADRNVYEFRYKGEPPRVKRVGYMAQELEKSDPHAVVKLAGGYKGVNLGLLAC